VRRVSRRRRYWNGAAVKRSSVYDDDGIRCDPAERRFRRAEAAVSVHVGTTATAAAIAAAGRRFVDSAFGEAVAAAAARV
jgi:hypothetical protein